MILIKINLQYLLNSGFDVNKSDAYGNSALLYAAYYGSIEVVRVLLDAPGVAVTQNMVDFASSEGHTEVAGLLTAALTG